MHIHLKGVFVLCQYYEIGPAVSKIAPCLPARLPACLTDCQLACLVGGHVRSAPPRLSASQLVGLLDVCVPLDSSLWERREQGRISRGWQRFSAVIAISVFYRG